MGDDTKEFESPSQTGVVRRAVSAELERSGLNKWSEDSGRLRIMLAAAGTMLSLGFLCAVYLLTTYAKASDLGELKKSIADQNVKITEQLAEHNARLIGADATTQDFRARLKRVENNGDQVNKQLYEIARATGAKVVKRKDPEE